MTSVLPLVTCCRQERLWRGGEDHERRGDSAAVEGGDEGHPLGGGLGQHDTQAQGYGQHVLGLEQMFLSRFEWLYFPHVVWGFKQY